MDENDKEKENEIENENILSDDDPKKLLDYANMGTLVVDNSVLKSLDTNMNVIPIEFRNKQAEVLLDEGNDKLE